MVEGNECCSSNSSSSIKIERGFDISIVTRVTGRQIWQ